MAEYPNEVRAIAYEVVNADGLVCYTTGDGQYPCSGEWTTLELDIDWADVSAAIEDDGWCGTQMADGEGNTEPVVVWPFSDCGWGVMPEAANRYLEQE